LGRSACGYPEIAMAHNVFWNQKPAGQKLKREITSKYETG
jgi:hypothetical protein